MKYIQEVTPLPELTYVHAMSQMLTHKRKGWGKTVPVSFIDSDLSRLEPLDEQYSSCEWNGDCKDSEYPKLCPSCLDSYLDLKASIEEDRYQQDV